MSVRRKSTLTPAVARPSTISIYSTAIDLNDDDAAGNQTFFRKYCSAIYLHKTNVYHILERQEGKRTLIYHLFVFLLTLISLVLGGISTIDECRTYVNTPMYYYELSLCIFFTYELIVRIWSAGCLALYRTWIGRFIFVTRPVIVLDILTLFGFALSLSTGLTMGEFPEITMKFLPILQMIRFLRVDRQLSSWKILKEIILTHHQELTVTIVIGFMFMIIGSYLVFIAETPVDEKLNTGSYRSMAESIWFSIITMTTIGFGDIYPSGYIAKIVSTTIIYLGVAFWCLPSGIIGSGLAIKVQEQKRDEALSRLVPAAASVIRNWWRLRCAYRGKQFTATWKIYGLMQRRVTALSSPQSQEPKSAPPGQTNPFRSSKFYPIRRKSITSFDDLPSRYRAAIKVLRILKYSSSCKKFHQASKPVDLKDIVTENTQVNNRLSMMLNDIQRRLDFVLGTTKLPSFLSIEDKRQLSLSARIEQLEELTNQFETKLNYLEQLALNLMQK